MSSEPEPNEAAKPRFRISWVGSLMLLAIIGVVAAIVIPSYGDYIHRSQASEAVSLLAGARAPLAEYFEAQKRWPDAIEKVAETTSGKYTRSVAITKGAGGTGELELTATMRTERVDRRVAGHTVRLTTPDGGKSWVCRPGTMPAKNLPAACRN